MASSFGKRKYTKGYYFASSGKVNQVKALKKSPVVPVVAGISQSSEPKKELEMNRREATAPITINHEAIANNLLSKVGEGTLSDFYGKPRRPLPADTTGNAKKQRDELKKYVRTVNLELAGFALTTVLMGILTKLAIFSIVATLAVIAIFSFQFFLRKKPKPEITRPNADRGRSFVQDNITEQQSLQHENIVNAYILAGVLFFLLGAGFSYLVVLYGVSLNLSFLLAMAALGLGLVSCIKASSLAERRHKGLGLLTFTLIMCLFGYLLILLA